MAYGTVNVDAMTTSDGYTSAGTYGFKNRIINGNFNVWQRGTTFNTPADGDYNADRWQYGANQSGKVNIAQSSSAPSGFSYSALVTSTSSYSIGASDLFRYTQRIEGFNTADLAFGTASAKTITLSFWVQSSLTGTFGGSLQNNNGDRSYPFTYVISSANTWTYCSVTVAGDTTGTWVGATNGNGLQLNFSMGAGSSRIGTAGAWAGAGYYGATGQTNLVATNAATWQITGVQLEKGSTATSFDYRPYGTELALCQRYYYKVWTGGGSGSGLFNQIAFANIRTTTSHYAYFQMPVQLRNSPSSIDYNSIGVIAAWGAGVTGVTPAIVSYGYGISNTLVDCVSAGAVGTAGNISFILGNNTSTGYIAFNAEL